MLKNIVAGICVFGFIAQVQAAPVNDWKQVSKALNGIWAGNGETVLKRIESCKIKPQKQASWIDVLTTATYNAVPNTWTWTYALTPHNGNDIRGLTITLGATNLAMVTNVTSPVGWTGAASGSAVYWETTPNGAYTLDSDQLETFTYGFDDPWGPVQMHQASCQDTYGYSGLVEGPEPPPIPEPMTALLGIMGLGSVAGFRRLRKS